MKPSLRVSLWTLLVFSPLLLTNTQAQCVPSCETSATTTTTTTTTTTVSFESESNCTLSIGDNVTGNGSISGLTPGSVYEIFFSCLNCCKEVTTKPEAVRNLRVTEITTSSVFVNWTKPEGNSSFYRVQWTDGDDNVTQTYINITSMTAGVQYEITVTAVADDGLTDGQSTTVSQYTKPEVVRNLTATEITTSSITLTWTEPEGGSSFYRVMWTDGATNWNDTVTETKLNVTELTPGVRYNLTVIVVAGDNKTQSEMSEIFHHTKPEVVRNLTVTDFTTSSVSLKWTEPEGNSSFYRVQWTNGNLNQILRVNNTYITISELTAGVQYSFSVTAVAADEETVGEATTVSQYTKPEVVRNLRVTEITTSSVFVNWTKPEGNSSFYRVQWTDGDDSVTQTYINITSMTAGVQYEITVTAVADDGLTDGQSTTVSQYTKPEVVRNLTATEITTSSITLTWTEPEGGSSFYRVMWTDEATNWNDTVTETKLNVTELTPGVRYNLTVTAVAGDNKTQSEMSEIFHHTKPEVVRNLTVTDFTTSSVSLKWTEPEGNSSFYRVQWTNGNLNQILRVTNTYITISELTAGVQYSFSVTAVAADEETVGEATTVSQYTKPAMVRNLTVTDVTTSSVSLNWIKPEGNAEWYKIQWTAGEKALNDSTNETSFTIKDLLPGFQYNIIVTAVAVTLSNEGAETLTTTFTKPEAVNDILVVGSTTNLSVSWTLVSGQVASYSVLLYRETQLVENATNLSNMTENTLFSGLKPGVLYCAAVVTKSGPFESSNLTVCNATLPNPPGPITVASQTVESINFTWAFPEDMDHNQYNFSVSSTNVSFLTDNNWFLLGNLQSGSPYRISVVTVGVMNYTSTAVTAENYTRPEAVNDILVVGSTTNLSVSWTLVSGQVASYSVLLYRETQLVENATNLSNMTENTLFSGLKPGVLYCAEVVTKSGPFESSNLTVCNATLPNPPGPITVASQTVESINFTWAFPEDMDHNQYNFSVSSTNVSFLTDNNWFLLGNLQSGSPYSISVVTVGVMNYTSTAVTAENYTRPYPVTSLRQTDITTNAVTLEWEQPESKLSYSYVVQVTNGSFSFSQVESAHTSRITGLRSGSNFSFTVTTQTADGTQADPVTVSYFTRPFSITRLEAETVNTTAILLHWLKPYEYRDDYTYWVETTGCASQNKTVAEETTVISELTPGSNCTFCVSAMAADGTEGEETCTSQHTEPERGQPSISSQGSNSSILVSWTKPHGNVEYYKVYLNSTSIGLNKTAHLNNTSTFVLFDDLPAGRLYSAKLTTHSGPHNASSGFVTNATFPNPPGPIEILKKTTSSIEFRWGEAPLVTDASFICQLTNTPSQGGENIITTKTSHTFGSLLSGTSFNISVATVGAMNFESERVHSYMVTTKPLSVQSLTTTAEDVSITVIWTKPGEYKESYRYNLTWQRLDEVIGHRIIFNDTKYNVDKLDPGTFYNVSVTTVTSDGTQGASIWISNCTNASPVKNLTCQGPNKTNAEIILSWTKPSGQNSGFLVTVHDKDIIPSNGTCCSHTVSKLRHYTGYNLSVQTLSCGQPSAPVYRSCWTGITKPPIPQGYESLVSVNDKAHDRFSLQINRSLLDSANGPITHVGVLVGNDRTDDTSNLAKYLEKTYEKWKADNNLMYLATVTENIVQQRSTQDHLNILVGNGSRWKGYTNGPLSPSGEYRYAIVIFTSLALRQDFVDSEKSLVSITNFYCVTLQNDPAFIGIAVGAALGIFFVLLIIIIGFIVYWKRISKKESSDIQIHSMRAKISVAVRVEDYEAYYKKQKADSNCGFAEEFEDLKVVGTGQSKIHAQSLENKPKNRYNNVLPYDSSRVKLSIIHGIPHDDYINANYMPGYLSRKEFIAAQGPLPTTVSEFWRMIWEKNVQTLVMLTRCNEQGRVKCDQYWGSGTKHFDDITVTTTSEIPLEDWTIRDFDIKNVKTAETRSVRHFHFTAWPDHGVPETTELLISFRHLVREHMNQYSRHSPTVVHCSAGVGRTGTFIAIDRLIFQIERENIVDVYGIVHDLRMHRPLMVQTEDQYVFLNQCALDIIRSRTGTNVDLIYQNTAALSIYENVEPKKGFPKNRYHNA